MKHKLLFLGDSLIEYFDWSGRFPDHEVYNLGIAGETVEGLLGRLKGIFGKVKHPDMVFVMSGINNMAMGDENIADTYQEILQELRQAYPSAVIVIHSLLPVRFPFIANEDIRHMNTRLKRMASDERTLYLDIHPQFLDEKGRPAASLLMDDGVHLSDEGYRVWSDEAARLIGRFLN